MTTGRKQRVYNLIKTTLKMYLMIISMSINIQQDATIHSLFYLYTAVHVSGGETTRNM